MPLHSSTERTADSLRLALVLLVSVLAPGCSPPLATTSEAGAEDIPDLPAPTDLPPETSEYEGTLIALNFDAEPSHFVACDTGELWEMTYTSADPGWRLMGSCDGVYIRVRGQLDRSVDPPVVIVDEVLEQRWCQPGHCAGSCNPVYDSCYLENYLYPCDPLYPKGDLSCDGNCTPVHFYATEEAGWMEMECRPDVGYAQAGDPCEYISDPPEIDTCAYGLRCWNPQGDLTKPGTCVPYCDLAGEVGPACDGTCVQCSGDDRGLCMHGCSGDDCNVAAFC